MTDKLTELTQLDQAHLLHPLHHPTLHQSPKIWVAGQGALVRDASGHEYIDGLSGLWNVNVGHGRRELAEAALEQMTTLAYSSAYAGSTNLPAIALAERLSEIAYSSINAFYFTSGGAEASETSFKTARFYWKALGKPDKIKIISRMRGYHGTTMAAMSATGMPPYWAMFEPRVPGFVQIDSPYPYRFQNTTPEVGDGVAAANLLEAAILREGPDTVAAFIAEPVQGAGGVIVPQPDYFARIRAICDAYEVLLISDEVITGFGRTGRWFGLEHYGIEPDIMQFAKAITSGYVPLGGIGVSDTIRDAMNSVPPERRWMHAYTYSGHPTCCAVAVRNIQIMQDEDLIARAAAAGQRLQAGLQSLASLDGVGNVRGQGMLGAVEVVADKATKQAFPPAAQIMQRLYEGLLERGLYTRVLFDAICLAPPLIATDAQIDQIVNIIGETIPAVLSSVQAAV